MDCGSLLPLYPVAACCRPTTPAPVFNLLLNSPPWDRTEGPVSDRSSLSDPAPKANAKSTQGTACSRAPSKIPPSKASTSPSSTSFPKQTHRRPTKHAPPLPPPHSPLPVPPLSSFHPFLTIHPTDAAPRSRSPPSPHAYTLPSFSHPCARATPAGSGCPCRPPGDAWRRHAASPASRSPFQTSLAISICLAISSRRLFGITT